VAVDLSQVRTQLAREINAEPDQLPDTVQIPASEAAYVCEKTEGALESITGKGRCVAQTTSIVLAMAVRRDLQLATRIPTIPADQRPDAPTPLRRPGSEDGNLRGR